MIKHFLSALGLGLFGLSLAHANPAQLKQNLEKNFPNISIQSIQATPIKDIYAVYMGGQLIYTNEEASYFFIGPLIDHKNQKNLTQESLIELEKINPTHLPLNQAIKHVKGNGERVLYIFSDPDCPYCQKLEQEMVHIDNVTIYLFLYPLTNLHPNAAKVSEQIWCSKNPYQTWENYVIKEIKPSSTKTCTTSPIHKNLALGQSLKINGTPTLFLKNGQRVTGALDANQLNRLLDETE